MKKNFLTKLFGLNGLIDSLSKIEKDLEELNRKSDNPNVAELNKKLEDVQEMGRTLNLRFEKRVTVNDEFINDFTQLSSELREFITKYNESQPRLDSENKSTSDSLPASSDPVEDLKTSADPKEIAKELCNAENYSNWKIKDCCWNQGDRINSAIEFLDKAENDVELKENAISHFVAILLTSVPTMYELDLDEVERCELAASTGKYLTAMSLLKVRAKEKLGLEMILPKCGEKFSASEQQDNNEKFRTTRINSEINTIYKVDKPGYKINSLVKFKAEVGRYVSIDAG